MVRKWLKQLLVNTRTREVSAAENPNAVDALDFEERALMAPRLGSADLCRLASHAPSFGYLLVGVTLRDRSLHPLPNDLEEVLEDDVCGALRLGELGRVNTMLRGDCGPLLVVAVALIDDDTGEDIEVGRMGALQETSGDALEKLIRPAFRELQLS